MTGPIDPGVLEAVLRTADAEDDEERLDLADGYEESGYGGLAMVVDNAAEAIESAVAVVAWEWYRTKLGSWVFRNGEEL